MTIIVLLLSVSFAVAVVFLVIFLWSIRSGQYDDVETPAMRMLFESGKEKQHPKDGMKPGK